MAMHFEEEMLRLSDDYPDQRQWANQPQGSSIRFSSNQGGTPGPFTYAASAGHHNLDNSSVVRRRSSKACDNCRKAKCKCEPGESTGDGCRNCELLGLVCTFLGPSRKRGPPKGYIDAIESRLHQLEAIVGALLLAAPVDARASTLLDDLRAVDEMARGVIDRVNAGPFGPLTRRVADRGGNELKAMGKRPAPQVAKISVSMPDDSTMVDPYKWQDMLQDAITHSVHAMSQPGRAGHAAIHDTPLALPAFAPPPNAAHSSDLIGISATRTNVEARPRSTVKRESSQPSLRPSWLPPTSSDSTANTRRRVDGNSVVRTAGEHESWSSSASSPASAGQAHQVSQSTIALVSHAYDTNSDEGSDSANDLARGIGSLSIDDSHDVRYHGKTSGLHLLMTRKVKDSASQEPELDERSAPYDHHSPDGASNTTESEISSNANRKTNTRERGGLWHFPPPGLWPPIDFSRERVDESSVANVHPSDNSGPSASTLAPSDVHTPRGAQPTIHPSHTQGEGEDIPYLEAQPTLEMPPIHVQERLISLYFSHVHPVLPIIHRDDLLEAWRASASAEASDGVSNGDLACKRTRRLEVLSQALLFAMFAVAARYLDEDKTTLPKGSMWPAGLLYRSHSRYSLFVQKLPSRVSAVQALILSAYFDVGVGAMASAWHATGLALRTALDIGLNRPVDEWVTPEGTRYFTKTEVETCRRAWYGVLLLENYVATYIGRPLALNENDYDTPLPSDDSMDEEIWRIPESDRGPTFKSRFGFEKLPYVPVPGRVIATFRQRARLASIHGAIMQDVYTVRLRRDRRMLAASLEGRLERWYLDLPTSLQWEYNINTQPCPPPHVMLLHMEYWCSVLLLNRPFIRTRSSSSRGNRSSDVDGPNGSPALRASQKAYGVCVGAANRLVSIAHLYAEQFAMDRCPVFFTYYVFTASIMHVTILLDSPNDVQASCYLLQAMEILESMAIVWPSAGRAYELLVGAKENIEEIKQNADAGHSDIHGHYEVSQQHAMPKRRADDEPEQLQHRFQLDHRRGTGTQSASIERQVQSSELDTSPIHPQREGLALGKIVFGTPSHQKNRITQSGGQPPQGIGVTDPLPVRVPMTSSWGGATPSTVPIYPTHAPTMFMDYSAHRLPGPPPTTFIEQPSSTFPDTPQQMQPATVDSASYSVGASGRYEQQVSPRPHQEQFTFQAQSALPSQHSQSFWNEYSGSGNDPFADPSSLSASLYNVPLLSQPRPQSYREQAPLGQHTLNPGSSIDSPAGNRQAYPPPPQQYSYNV